VKRTTKFSKVRLVRVAPGSACLALLLLNAFFAVPLCADYGRVLLEEEHRHRSGPVPLRRDTPERRADARGRASPAPFPPALHPRPAALQPASLVRRQYNVANGQCYGDAVRLPLCACARVSCSSPQTKQEKKLSDVRLCLQLDLEDGDCLEAMQQQVRFHRC